MTLPARLTPGIVTLIIAGALAATAGCGSEDATSAAQADDVSSGTELLITSEGLPRGWGDSNSQGVDYRLSVCGVDIEPEPPARATSVRFSEGPLGPFLEQHVRVYRDDVVSGVIDGLRETLPGCSSYSVTGAVPGADGTRPVAEFEVEPLTVANAPDDSVAWRQTSKGDLPVTSDMLLVRRDDTAVMLMSYAIRAEPDPAVLEAAVAALPETE